jgi:ACS family glucarate transporter-like MFS transporter
LDLKASAFFGMLPFLAMATFSTLGGFIGDRLTQRFGKRAGRCIFSGGAMALSRGFIVLGMQAQDARVASIVLAGGAGALYLSQSAFWSMTADLAGRSAGSVSGVMNMGNQIGGTITARLPPCWLMPSAGRRPFWPQRPCAPLARLPGSTWTPM